MVATISQIHCIFLQFWSNSLFQNFSVILLHCVFFEHPFVCWNVSLFRVVMPLFTVYINAEKCIIVILIIMKSVWGIIIIFTFFISSLSLRRRFFALIKFTSRLVRSIDQEIWRLFSGRNAVISRRRFGDKKLKSIHFERVTSAVIVLNPSS